MKYGLIFMDLDETLFDFTRAEKAALELTFSELGIPHSPQSTSTYERINKGLWRMLERGEIKLEALKSERFRIFFQEMGLSLDARSASDVYIGHLSRGIHPLEGSVELCAYLAEKYRVVILSNGIRDVQIPRIGNSPIAPYVEGIVVSEEAGAGKPDPRIFEYACDRFDFHEKSRMVMVGDSIASDIMGGIQFGIDTIWVNPAANPAPEGVKPTYEVRDLDAIREIL
jgi:2-haloacid dehalogenase